VAIWNSTSSLPRRTTPKAVDEAQLTVRWYTNDDFKLHYREQHANHLGVPVGPAPESAQYTRPLPPPPTAPTPGEDTSWPDDHRDVVALVLDEIEDRITALWSE